MPERMPGGFKNYAPLLLEDRRRRVLPWLGHEAGTVSRQRAIPPNAYRVHSETPYILRFRLSGFGCFQPPLSPAL